MDLYDLKSDLTLGHFSMGGGHARIETGPSQKCLILRHSPFIHLDNLNKDVPSIFYLIKLIMSEVYGYPNYWT